MNGRVDQFRRAALAAAVWVLGCLAPAVWGQGTVPAGASPLKDARLAIQKWVEAEQLTSKEKQDWELGRQILEDRAGLVEREMKDLGERAAEARKKADEAGKGNAKLVLERDSLEAAATFLAERVPALERRVKGEVLPLLPDALAHKIEPLVRRLPEDPAAAKTTLLERFQNVVGILNEIDKFNRDVTVVRELRVIADGKTAEVRTMYLGLGQAFYADPEKGVAGRGVPSENGWKWEALPGAAAQVAAAIGITENEKAAEFVPLPVKIR